MGTLRNDGWRLRTRRATVPVALGLAVATGWSAVGSPVLAETGGAWPWSEAPPETVLPAANEVGVTFEGTNVRLPHRPVVVDGTTMVPARALLEGFGYRLEWDEAADSLKAAHPAGQGVSMTFRVGSKEIAVGSDPSVNGITASGTMPLDVAPYIDRGLLWIPLRTAAEASGMIVTWNSFDRLVTVRDPNAELRFSVATRADNGEYGTPDKLRDYIKSKWSADVRFTLIPPDYYNEKVNVMIAAGDPADLMLLGKPYAFHDVLFESVATDLTDLLAGYPRLRALAESGSPSARTIDGRMYGVPRPGDPHAAPFPAIRQDWLQKLDLAVPKTMDELYKALDKFVHADPDADGKHNTIGLTGAITGGGLGDFAWVEQAFTGSPHRFAVKDGKVTDTAVGDGERQALEWLARAYRDGLIDKEFALLSGDQVNDKLDRNRAGLAALTLDEAAKLSVWKEEDVYPQKPAWVPLAELSAGIGAGAIAPWSAEGAGLYIIPRTVASDKAESILKWLDEGLRVTEAGEWGDAGELKPEDLAAIENVFGRQSALPSDETLAPLPEAVQDGYRKAYAAWQNVSYAGRTLPQANAIFATGDYAEMNRKLEELKVKVIVGEASMADWDKAVQEMVASPAYRDMMGKLEKLAAK
ncbi:extracellular solute-binding protein [Paenibacillus flagellatus]|uniref:extracellular solute-binding protein n=1 Tax=Paenibacillus flagellatus TaxID=2211139 RepID=UPI001305144C|nr:extracellular solute-binding protein [Paenibacillus flagellatus]